LEFTLSIGAQLCSSSAPNHFSVKMLLSEVAEQCFAAARNADPECLGTIDTHTLAIPERAKSTNPHDVWILVGEYDGLGSIGQHPRPQMTCHTAESRSSTGSINMSSISVADDAQRLTEIDYFRLNVCDSRIHQNPGTKCSLSETIPNSLDIRALDRGMLAVWHWHRAELYCAFLHWCRAVWKAATVQRCMRRRNLVILFCGFDCWHGAVKYRSRKEGAAMRLQVHIENMRRRSFLRCWVHVSAVSALRHSLNTKRLLTSTQQWILYCRRVSEAELLSTQRALNRANTCVGWALRVWWALARGGTRCQLVAAWTIWKASTGAWHCVRQHLAQVEFNRAVASVRFLLGAWAHSMRLIREINSKKQEARRLCVIRALRQAVCKWHLKVGSMHHASCLAKLLASRRASQTIQAWTICMCLRRFVANRSLYAQMRILSAWATWTHVCREQREVASLSLVRIASAVLHRFFYTWAQHKAIIFEVRKRGECYRSHKERSMTCIFFSVWHTKVVKLRSAAAAAAAVRSMRARANLTEWSVQAIIASRLQGRPRVVILQAIRNWRRGAKSCKQKCTLRKTCSSQWNRRLCKRMLEAWIWDVSQSVLNPFPSEEASSQFGTAKKRNSFRTWICFAALRGQHRRQAALLPPVCRARWHQGFASWASCLIERKGRQLLEHKQSKRSSECLSVWFSVITLCKKRHVVLHVASQTWRVNAGSAACQTWAAISRQNFMVKSSSSRAGPQLHKQAKRRSLHAWRGLSALYGWMRDRTKIAVCFRLQSIFFAWCNVVSSQQNSRNAERVSTHLRQSSILRHFFSVWRDFARESRQQRKRHNDTLKRQHRICLCNAFKFWSREAALRIQEKKASAALQAQFQARARIMVVREWKTHCSRQASERVAVNALHWRCACTRLRESTKKWAHFTNQKALPHKVVHVYFESKLLSSQVKALAFWREVTAETSKQHSLWTHTRLRAQRHAATEAIVTWSKVTKHCVKRECFAQASLCLNFRNCLKPLLRQWREFCIRLRARRQSLHNSKWEWLLVTGWKSWISYLGIRRNKQKTLQCLAEQVSSMCIKGAIKDWRRTTVNISEERKRLLWLLCRTSSKVFWHWHENAKRKRQIEFVMAAAKNQHFLKMCGRGLQDCSKYAKERKRRKLLRQAALQYSNSLLRVLASCIIQSWWYCTAARYQSRSLVHAMRMHRAQEAAKMSLHSWTTIAQWRAHCHHLTKSSLVQWANRLLGHAIVMWRHSVQQNCRVWLFIHHMQRCEAQELVSACFYYWLIFTQKRQRVRDFIVQQTLVLLRLTFLAWSKRRQQRESKVEAAGKKTSEVSYRLLSDCFGRWQHFMHAQQARRDWHARKTFKQISIVWQVWATWYRLHRVGATFRAKNIAEWARDAFNQCMRMWLAVITWKRYKVVLKQVAKESWMAGSRRLALIRWQSTVDHRHRMQELEELSTAQWARMTARRAHHCCGTWIAHSAWNKQKRRLSQVSKEFNERRIKDLQ